MSTDEYLVVVGAGALPALRRAAQVQVTQVLPPRLALVRAAGTAELRALPGVLAAYAPGDEVAVGEPDEQPDEGERLFVAAWQARALPKARPGDGLSWDAPGFRPPDSREGEGDGR